MAKSSFYSKIVGTSFRRDIEKAELERLRVGQVLPLIREPDNKFDPNAIKVMSGMWHLGYIPRDTAESLAPTVDEGHKVYAMVTELTGKKEGKEHRGVNIEVITEYASLEHLAKYNPFQAQK